MGAESPPKLPPRTAQWLGPWGQACRPGHKTRRNGPGPRPAPCPGGDGWRGAIWELSLPGGEVTPALLAPENKVLPLRSPDTGAGRRHMQPQGTQAGTGRWGPGPRTLAWKASRPRRRRKAGRPPPTAQILSRDGAGRIQGQSGQTVSCFLGRPPVLVPSGFRAQRRAAGRAATSALGPLRARAGWAHPALVSVPEGGSRRTQTLFSSPDASSPL